jgi:hypothetical protein
MKPLLTVDLEHFLIEVGICIISRLVIVEIHLLRLEGFQEIREGIAYSSYTDASIYFVQAVDIDGIGVLYVLIAMVDKCWLHIAAGPHHLLCYPEQAKWFRRFSSLP